MEKYLKAGKIWKIKNNTGFNWNRNNYKKNVIEYSEVMFHELLLVIKKIFSKGSIIKSNAVETFLVCY